MIIKRSLAEEVAAKLQEQISLGRYKVNEKLPIEPEMMKTFGVGRSTVREAVKILSNAGLLRVQQGVGTFVQQAVGGREPMDQRLKRASFDDLNEIRQLLEVKAAEKAATNRSEANIETMRMQLAIRKRTAEQGLAAECIDADVQFHVAIAEAAGNEILIDLYKLTAVHLKNHFLQIYPDTRIFIDTYDLHHQLFKCIVAGDAKKALQTAQKIIANNSN